jgi:hypothetical protein
MSPRSDLTRVNVPATATSCPLAFTRVIGRRLWDGPGGTS